MTPMVSKRTTRASLTLSSQIRAAFDDRSIRRGMAVAEGDYVAWQTWIEGRFDREFTHTRGRISLKKDACELHDNRVHYFCMKNITLSADEQLIEQARLLAKSQHKTLNAIFREWLEQFTARSGGIQEFDALMKRLKHVQAGRHFSRDEMNER